MMKKRIQRSKILLPVFGILFVLSAVAAAVLIRIAPSERSYQTEKSNINDIVSLDKSGWMYSTSDGRIVVMEDKDTQKMSCNILDMAEKEYGLSLSVLQKFYKSENSDYLWFFASDLDDSGKSTSYLIQGTQEDDSIRLLAYTPFDGSLESIYLLEEEEDLYAVTAGKKVAELFSYHTGDIASGIVESTYLYDCVQDSRGVKLTALRMPNGVNNFSTDGEYLYILYDAGMIRVARTFGDVTYESKSGSYHIDSLDTKKYISFGISGVASSGGAFVREKETFYVTARNASLYTFTTQDIDALGMKDSLRPRTVDDIAFDPIPRQNAALYYEDATRVGYVLHDSSSQITKIDFAKESAEFSFNLEFNIQKMIQGENEDTLFYIYKNENKTEASGQTILSVMNVNTGRLKTPIRIGIVLTLTLAAFFLVAFLILLHIVRKNRQKEALKILRQIRRQKMIYLALLPSVILLVMFCYYEAVASIGLSFFDYSADSPTMIWNNFANYRKVFLSSDSLEAFGNMILFLGFDLITAIVPPLVFAFFLSVMKSETLSNGIRTSLFVASVVPTIAGMLIWKTGIYGGDGALNYIIRLCGGEPIAFLGQTDYAKWAVLMMAFPFVGSYLIFYGGMMNIPKSYYEAAELEGIGIWRRFFSIDIPLVFPQLKYVFITSFIFSLQNFQRTYMTTGGSFGTKTPIHLMYQNMVNGEYGQASAYATVIFILLFGASYLNLRKQKQDMEG